MDVLSVQNNNNLNKLLQQALPNIIYMILADFNCFSILPFILLRFIFVTNTSHCTLLTLSAKVMTAY